MRTDHGAIENSIEVFTINSNLLHPSVRLNSWGDHSPLFFSATTLLHKPPRSNQVIGRYQIDDEEGGRKWRVYEEFVNPLISSMSLHFLISFTPCVSSTNLHPYCRPYVCLVQYSTPSTPLPPRPPLLPPAWQQRQQPQAPPRSDTSSQLLSNQFSLSLSLSRARTL